MLKPRFAGSISQYANKFFFFIIYLKKILGKGPQVTLLIPLWHFSDCCNSRFNSNAIEIAVTRNKPCTWNQVASEWVKKISTQSWVELHFTTISYILSFNYSYRYEIYLTWIMYTANSSIMYSKEKTVWILGTWHQYLVNVSGLRYSKQIEFQEELINFLRTWLL